MKKHSRVHQKGQKEFGLSNHRRKVIFKAIEDEKFK
jgi:hypothetical protein